jgi:hypothetical protein
MILRIADIDGNVLCEENVVLGTGDILLVSIPKYINLTYLDQLQSQVKAAIEDPETGILMVMEDVKFSVLQREDSGDSQDTVG